MGVEQGGPSEEDLRIRTEVGEPDNRGKFSVDDARDDALDVEKRDKSSAVEIARGQKIMDDNLKGKTHGDIAAMTEYDRGLRIVEEARRNQSYNNDIGKGRLAQQEKNIAHNQREAQKGRDAIQRIKHGK